MGSVEEVSRLLADWEAEHSDGNDPTGTLIKLAELFEVETEAFLKKDPDPFDDRHPSRSHPECVLGHLLKTVFKNENFVDQIVRVYCQSDNSELCTAACRLLLDMLPGLEDVVFNEEGFVSRLLHLAENASDPLRSYATGLLAAAVDVQTIAAEYREKNSYFVSVMLKRLHELANTYLKNHESRLNDSSNPERPFAHLNNESDSVPDSVRSAADFNSPVEKKEVVGLDLRVPINESSNSNWPELENHVIGSLQVYPVTIGAQQRYILQYLTPMGEYSDLIGYIFETNALSLILQYINFKQNSDIRLAFDALKYLASLLCHKKIAIEFLNAGGLHLLLKIPRPSIAATGVSLCLYYLSYLEEAMERICLMPTATLSELIGYALWLLECSHDSGRCHAAMFFGFCFTYQIMLQHFDLQRGLRKLFNVMSTLDIFIIDNHRPLSDDQVFGNRQTARHVCGSLKRYFEAHLYLEAEARRSPKYGQVIARDKAVCHTYENVQRNIETLIELSAVPMLHWKPVQEFLNLDGVVFLLDLIASYFDLSYSGRGETVRNALDILKICSLTVATQLVFFEKITTIDHQNITGMSVILQSAEGEDLPDPDIQRAALHIIINCVCTEKPAVDRIASENFVLNNKVIKSTEELCNKLRKCVRTSNGIMVLIDLISAKSPITDADSIRALACKALCGLSRSDTVKQIISKLPLVTSGQLLALIREPILQDKVQEHYKFYKYGVELIERVTGSPVSVGSDSSVINLNKAEVVAKTKVFYNEAQLLQLIIDHLQSKGFTESAFTLQREMQKFSISPATMSNSKFTLKSARPVMRNSVMCDKPTSIYGNVSLPSKSHTHSEISMTSPRLPPPTVPLRLIVKRRHIPQVRHSGSRLQKPQTCSGDYNVSTGIKRQVLPNYHISSTPISLDSIVTEYLRKQHALCKTPMLACPPFDLFVPHKCPEPHHKRNAPNNSTVRIQKREISFPEGGYGSSILNRKSIYSKFRRFRVLSDNEGLNDFTYCTFANYEADKPYPRIIVGQLCGVVAAYNLNTGEEEVSRNCHNRDITHIETQRSSPLVITCDGSRRGNTGLWKLTSNAFDSIVSFQDNTYMEFAKRSVDRMVGTRSQETSIFDITTLSEIQTFNHGNQGNNYLRNTATFDFNDELILSDGLLWDVKSGRSVHKLDKFNAKINGVFHPNGREIVSNSEVWDLRTFKLLRTVAALDQRKIIFNAFGDVIYGVSCDENAKIMDDKVKSFYIFDADDYSTIATINVKKPVYILSTDPYDRYLGVIEKQLCTIDHNFLTPVSGVDCVCRVYQVGMSKEREEVGEESDDSDNGSDDDDGDDDAGDESNFNLDDPAGDVDLSIGQRMDDDLSSVNTSDSESDILFAINGQDD